MLSPECELALRVRQLLDAFQRMQLHHTGREALEVTFSPLAALTLHPAFAERFPAAAATLPAEGDIESQPALWPAFLAGLLADATPATLQWLSNALVDHATTHALLYATATPTPQHPLAEA
jgi:hypothetical protein